MRLRASAVVGLLLLGTACSTDTQPATTADEAVVSEDVAAAQEAPEAGEGDEQPGHDPVEAWLTESAAALVMPDLNERPQHFWNSMHPAVRSEFRWCDTSWIGEAGIDWANSYDLDSGSAEEIAQAWTGTEGPLKDATFPDARLLTFELREAEGGVTTVAMPFVVEGSQVYWLADCPPQPEQEPESPGEPETPGTTAAPETSTPPSAQPPPASTPPATSDTGSITVSGDLRVDASFGGSMRQHASDSCDGWGERSYQLQVLDGAGTIVAIGTISGGSFSREVYDFGIVIRCDFTYTVTVQQAQVYAFVVTQRSDDRQLERRVLSHADLTSRGAPSFFIQNSYFV